MMITPDFKTVMTLSKKESGRNIFGAFGFRLINFTYWLFFFALVVVGYKYENIYFSLAAMVLIISKHQYMNKYYEKNLEKHNALITDIIKHSYASTGVKLTSRQVIILWQRKVLWSGDYFFAFKEASDPLEFDLAYAKKTEKDPAE